MRKKIFIFLILVQCVVIIFLLIVIFNKKSSDIRGVNVNVIKKESVTFPNINTKLMQHFYELVPNPKYQTPERWLKFTPTYSINADTLNEANEYFTYKNPNTFRIITIGDSFTFGHYVNTKDNWTELLEDDLKVKCKNNKYEVINLGQPGYDLAYTSYRYLTRGEKYNPDLIIYLLKDDDLSEIKDVTAKVKWEYINNFEKSAPGDLILKENVFNKHKEAFAEGIKELRKYYSEEEVTSYQLGMLKKLIDTQRKIFITNVQKYSASSLRDLNKELMGKQNVLFEPNKLYIKELFEEQYTYLPYDGHPNAQGHKLIKNKLLEYLINNKLIPCD